MISEPMVRLAQTVHLSWIQTDWNELPLDPRHIGVPSGASKMISKPMVHLAQTVHLSQIQTDRNELPLEPRHLGVPSGASRTISKPMVHLVQTVNLSCTYTNTVSKWTETSFHRTHITRSSTRCLQNDFWAYDTFAANRAPILRQN
jgi:hypothetical protein